MHTILSTTVLVAAVAMAYPAALTAQAGRGGQGPRYDTSTEVTVRGTVQEVKEVADATRGGSATGTHLVVKTGVKVAAGEALIAREVRKGAQTVTLRDDKGIPKWSRGRR
jgi:hypothetical protein